MYRLISFPIKRILERWSRGRLPQTEGKINLKGLNGDVTVHRDSWGIPRIVTPDRHDLFFAQGFVHAQDRLWQMDINRRAANGRLAEVVGSDALDSDRLTRTLGFRRLAPEVWKITKSEIKLDIEAYCHGVNAFINQLSGPPIEFSLLRYEPEPWDPMDSVAYGRLIAWSLSSGWAGELTRARLIEKLGAQLAAELEPVVPEGNPITLPEGIEIGELRVDPMTNAASGPYLSRGPEGSGRGSNGWVVAGTRTTTGFPILCNDMHLPVGTPSLWYYVKLYQLKNAKKESAYRVSGVSQPGLPYVLIGHNENIAWGATLSFVDTEDLYLERVNPARNDNYEFRGQWRQAEVLEEIIRVKGQSDHNEQVTSTHHGPIISSVVPSDGKSISLSSVALEPGATFEGFALIGQAQNWQEFKKAVRAIRVPSLNLIYADNEGNIGYYVSGRVPIRSGDQGSLPKVGWSGEQEWNDEIPFEEMPHALNPKSGFIISANNKIVDDNYPYYLGSSWRNGYRSARIEQLIKEKDLLSPQDCLQMHMDCLSLPGIEFARKIKDVAIEDENSTEVRKYLRSWDGQLDSESIGGTVFQVMLKSLSNEILEPALGSVLAKEILGEGPHPILAPVNELSGHWTSTLLRLLDDRNLLEKLSGKSYEAVISDSLSRTVCELKKHLGSDPQKWRWGRLHQISFQHTLGSQRLLDQIFSQGPYPVGGDSDTVQQVAIAPGGKFHDISVSPSYRHVVNFADLDDSKAMYVPGQSGHLGSRHYGDLVQPWLVGEYFPMTNTDPGSDTSDVKSLTLGPTLTSR